MKMFIMNLCGFMTCGWGAGKSAPRVLNGLQFFFREMSGEPFLHAEIVFRHGPGVEGLYGVVGKLP